MKIDLIGVPLDLGSERIGVDMGPNALRYQKFVSNLVASGLEINDLGNIPCPIPEEVEIGRSDLKYADPIVQVCESLSASVEDSLRAGRKLVVVGGDHSIALGSVSAVSRVNDRVGLIWIDAHGDLNTTATTPSGNIHGMVLAALLGHGDERLTKFIGESPAVADGDVVLVGLKDLDPAEQDFIKAHELNAFFVKDILANGLAPVFKAIDQLNSQVDAVWLSFDLDGVDAEVAPGVGMPNKGGLTYREIHAIIEYVGQTCDIAGLDLVEYNPVNDISHKTAVLATELVAKVFGKEFSPYTEYVKEHGISG